MLWCRGPLLRWVSSPQKSQARFLVDQWHWSEVFSEVGQFCFADHSLSPCLEDFDGLVQAAHYQILVLWSRGLHLWPHSSLTLVFNNKSHRLPWNVFKLDARLGWFMIKCLRCVWQSIPVLHFVTYSRFVFTWFILNSWMPQLSRSADYVSILSRGVQNITGKT